MRGSGLRIVEVMVGADEVENGEVVFAVVEAGAAANDLFERHGGNPHGRGERTFRPFATIC